MRDAERMVWGVLQQLDYSWHVFYSARENSGSGWDREVDFVLIRLNRIFYCEVKGGVVVVDQRAGPGVTWAHFTRSREPISKRADPKQLWMAKAALGETIRQISGQSPRDLGFREHDLFIFPHTPKEVTQGADLERRNTHYVFAEDIGALPARLQQIVDGGKGRFIDRDRITGIINSLDAMVLKESGGTLPPSGRSAPAPSHENSRPAAELFARRPIWGDNPSRSFKRRRIRLPRRWGIMAALLGLFVISGLFADLSMVPVDRPANPISPMPQSARSASKPPTRSPSTALPSFIAPASAEAVEQAITGAQDLAVYVSWQSDTQYGFVILRSDDGNGCRRYQVSRHDLPTTKYDIVRRCSDVRQ